MSKKSPKQLHRVALEYRNGNIRTVTAKGSSREVAERRALKFNPAAVGVKR